MKRILPLAALTVAAAALVAGCGGGGSSSAAGTGPAAAPATAAPTATTAAVRAPRGALVKVRSTRYGRILVDRRGQALYQFTRDTGAATSRCTGDCARAWPPLYASGGAPVAGSGATQAKLGTIRRSGGRRQVTYAGHPLYYYSADTPSQILCQNVKEFGGLWLVTKPSGAPVR